MVSVRFVASLGGAPPTGRHSQNTECFKPDREDNNVWLTRSGTLDRGALPLVLPYGGLVNL